MKNATKCLILATLVMVLAFSATAFAWQVNQHYTNNTGQTAYDLTKIIPGIYDLTEVMLDLPFQQCDVVHIFGHTIVHWHDGTVAPGQQGHACFSTSSPVRPPIVVSLWTDDQGNFIGVAGPVVGVLPWVDPSDGMVKITIGHEMAEWTGTGYPIEEGDGPGTPKGTITGTEVYYAYTDRRRPLEELDDGLFVDPDLDWVPMNGFALGYEDETILDAGYPVGDYVLFRFELSGDGEDSYYVVQHEVKRAVPSLTEWGVIALVSIMLLAGAMVIVRRRRAMARG